MRSYCYTTFPEESDVNHAIDTHTRVFMDERAKLLKKGFLMTHVETKVGRSGQDYLYRRFTALSRCEVFKIPRIIGKLLSKQH